MTGGADKDVGTLVICPSAWFSTPANGAPSSAMASKLRGYYSALLVREGDGVKIFEETVNVAVP